MPRGSAARSYNSTSNGSASHSTRRARVSRLVRRSTAAGPRSSMPGRWLPPYPPNQRTRCFPTSSRLIRSKIRNVQHHPWVPICAAGRACTRRAAPARPCRSRSVVSKSVSKIGCRRGPALPLTSSLSGCRRSGWNSGFAGRELGHKLAARGFSYLAMSCAYPVLLAVLRPVRSARWADIPQLSTRRPCPAAWQQYGSVMSCWLWRIWVAG